MGNGHANGNGAGGDEFRHLAALLHERWRVSTEDPFACWPWPHARARSGVVQVNAAGETTTVGRLAWCLAYGVEPRGRVYHICTDPGCANPRHLSKRHPSFRRAVPRGAKMVTNAKLSPAQVRALRRVYKVGRRGDVARLARRFEVTEATASRAARRLSWRTAAVA